MSPILAPILASAVRWPVSPAQPVIPSKAALDSMRLDWLRYQAHVMGRELRQRQGA